MGRWESLICAKKTKEAPWWLLVLQSALSAETGSCSPGLGKSASFAGQDSLRLTVSLCSDWLGAAARLRLSLLVSTLEGYSPGKSHTTNKRCFPLCS